MRLVLLLALSACRIPAPPPTVIHYSDADPARFDALVSSLGAEMKKAGIPGASLAIVESGALTHAAGIGLRDREKTDGVTPGSYFRIASISKLILALAATSLVESGELSLDARVSDYVPGFFSPITLRQALNHTSGLADAGDPTCVESADAWLEKYADKAVWAPPGAVWNYANPNYLIVATVIEHVTGRPFSEVVAERVFVPAGMTMATYDPLVARAAENAVQHTANDAFSLDAFNCVLLRAAGGVITTAPDLAHLAEALMAGAFPAWELMLSDPVDMRRGAGSAYGLGVFSSPGIDGHPTAQHGGGMAGLQTLLAMVPDQKFAVVAFFNGDMKPMPPVLGELVRNYRGVTATPPPAESAPDPAPFLGRYEDAPHALVVEVIEEEGRLAGHFVGDSVDVRAPFVHTGGDTYLVKWPIVGTKTFAQIEATFFPGGYLVTRLGVALRM